MTLCIAIDEEGSPQKGGLPCGGACRFAPSARRIAWNRQLTEHAETKVDGDDDEASVSSQGGPVEGISGTPRVGITVDEQQSRQQFLAATCNTAFYQSVSPTSTDRGE